MLKAQPQEACRGAIHLQYCGQPMCNKGWMAMTGIGKQRFATLRTAVRQGAEHCPFDSRYILRGKQPLSEAQEKVYDFLQELYTESAEKLPDAANSNKRPRQGDQRLDAKGLDRSAIRHLPPGSINEYHNLCLAANPGVSISRKLFCSEPRQQYFHKYPKQRRCRQSYA